MIQGSSGSPEQHTLRENLCLRETIAQAAAALQTYATCVNVIEAHMHCQSTSLIHHYRQIRTDLTFSLFAWSLQRELFRALHEARPHRQQG